MTPYRLIFTLVFSVSALLATGCSVKPGKGGPAGAKNGADASKNDLVNSKTCTGNPPGGRTLMSKWSFKQNVKGGSYQMDLNITNNLTLISVTCVAGTQIKILSDSVPSHLINGQFVISDLRNQHEVVGKMNCDLSVPAQTWNYTLTGNCLVLSSGNQSRTWVNTN